MDQRLRRVRRRTLWVASPNQLKVSSTGAISSLPAGLNMAAPGLHAWVAWTFEAHHQRHLYTSATTRVDCGCGAACVQ
eukprot:5395401-Prymnesium_polylepis.3